MTLACLIPPNNKTCMRGWDAICFKCHWEELCVLPLPSLQLRTSFPTFFACPLVPFTHHVLGLFSNACPSLTCFFSCLAFSFSIKHTRAARAFSPVQPHHAPFGPSFSPSSSLPLQLALSALQCFPFCSPSSPHLWDLLQSASGSC